MRKIIFINRYFYPDHSATSQLLTDLVFDLTKQNVDVQVITSRQIYDNPSSKLHAVETVCGVHIKRVWTSRFGRGRLWGRVLDYLTFYLSTAWCLARTVDRGDVVVAKTDPPLISVVAAVMVGMRGATLINWVQDMFPEVASALGVKGMAGVESLLRRLRNFSFRIASTNVALGNRMAAKIIAQGINPEKVKVIPNWSDGMKVKPIASDQNTLRKEWGVHDKFVVGYSGNMGRAHEFRTIIDTANLLKFDRNIVFIFIGNGANREWIGAEVRKLQLGNVIFKPYQDQDKLTQSLCVPDIHIISLWPKLEGLIVPSKFYGIAAAGRPALYIGDSDGEIPKILREEQCGYTINVGDAEGAAMYLRKLSSDRDAAYRMGLNSRSVFERRFDRKLSLALWREILQL